MSVADKIKTGMSEGSWIRRMFEEGNALKQKYGAANVFDLSLGNPVMEPPEEFRRELHVVRKLQSVTVSVSEYQRKRDFLYGNLTKAGYSMVKPQGAFYLFPKSPIEDEVAFVRDLQELKVLVVPGLASACPATSASAIASMTPPSKALLTDSAR